MSDGKRITFSDIAHAAGVNKSTVCLALRNDPRVKAATRERILALAEELDYRPDTRISQLMSYMRNVNSAQADEVIAVIRFDEKAQSSKDELPLFREFRLGAREELHKRGYQVTDFFLRDYQLNFSRVFDVLYHRGIRGVLLTPPTQVLEIQGVDWSKFAAVTMGYRLRVPCLHHVVCNHVKIIRTIFERMEALGYRRPFFAYRPGRDKNVYRLWTTAFYGEGRHFPHLERIESYSGESNSAFLEAVQKAQPDCVIGLSYNFCQALVDKGYKLPEDLGFILLDRHDGPEGITAIDQLPSYQGRCAVRQLISMLSSSDFGLPENQLTLTIQPQWVEGRTTCRVSNC
jgi:DNA-binding LacI/PurR family transcriptional regulator